MRRIVVSQYVTLDGVFEDLDKWHFDFWHDDIARYKLAELIASDGLLMGRITYEVYAVTWPEQKDEEGFADRMNELPKYVVSRKLDSADWNNSTLISDDDVPGAIRDLKASGEGTLLLSGSGRLSNALFEHGLVDELRLLVHPVVYGKGRKLFEEGLDTRKMTLIESTPFATGVVALHYEPS